MSTSNLGKGSVMTNHVGAGNRHALTNRGALLEIGQSPWLSRLIVIWMAGTVVLLPVKIVDLPRNFELVDIWILMGLPVVLLFYSFRQHKVISLSYAVPMWLILIASLISAFLAPATLSIMFVILKEMYLFVWFIAVTVFLYVLNARDLRRVLYIWSAVVILHGLLMVAQFLSPEIWEFTNSLGGNTARIEGYRAAGLFICDKAGCANKAAYFQLLGFVPLVLAGFSKKTTAVLGIFLFASLLTTGSMGATLAFAAGLVVAIFAIAFIQKNLLLAIKYFMNFGFAILLLAGAFLIIVSQNQSYRAHFEKIIVGRFDKSSSGRFDLWQRGIDVLLERNAFFWGVGPENFRVLDADQTDNQLHNDTLAFLVERGLIGLLGLALFAAISMRKAIYMLRISGKAPKLAQLELVVFLGTAIKRTIPMLQISGKAPKPVQLELVVFLAVIVATIVESLTHQLFHTRELWLVLALQEAVYFRISSYAKSA